jgi:hypothetical protein
VPAVGGPGWAAVRETAQAIAVDKS